MATSCRICLLRLSQRSSYTYGGNGIAKLWRNGIISYETRGLKGESFLFFFFFFCSQELCNEAKHHAKAISVNYFISSFISHMIIVKLPIMICRESGEEE